MAKSELVTLMVGLLLSLAFLGAVATTIGDRTQLSLTSDSGTEINTPFNITLSQIPVTVLNVSNGTGTVPADNYTVNITGQYIQINSNETYTGGNLTATYTYEPENYITGIVAVLLTLVILLVAIGIIFTAIGKSKG